MVPVWVPFKIMSDSPALHSRWLLLLRIEISSIVHCCFIINLNEHKYLLQLHGNEQFNIYSGFSVQFFFQLIYTDCANWEYFDKITFKSSPLKPLNQIKPNLAGVGTFQNCVRQTRPPFKMAAVTKNRNFLNCPLLLYYKSK